MAQIAAEVHMLRQSRPDIRLSSTPVDCSYLHPYSSHNTYIGICEDSVAHPPAPFPLACSTMSAHQQQQASTSDSIEISKGDKAAHGTADYPDALTEITEEEWDIVIIGAGPAGLMTAVSTMRWLAQWYCESLACQQTRFAVLTNVVCALT